MGHQLFYATVAGIAPVLFLALVVQERVAEKKADLGYWDAVNPVIAALLLGLSEVFALAPIYRGRVIHGELLVVSVSLAGAALLLFGDSSTARLQGVGDKHARRRVVATYLVVYIATIALSLRAIVSG
jgi:hypothetical protein